MHYFIATIAFKFLLFLFLLGELELFKVSARGSVRFFIHKNLKRRRDSKVKKNSHYGICCFSKSMIIYLHPFVQEATPVRLKQFHLVNCPPAVDKLFAVVKPILPGDICNLVSILL